MNTANENGRRAVENLFAWHLAAGTLSAREAQSVEAALAPATHQQLAEERRGPSSAREELAQDPSI